MRAACAALAAWCAGCGHPPDPALPPPGAWNPREPGAGWQTDRVLLADNPNLDVLFVIDNSCSMVTEQETLTALAPDVYDRFSALSRDYHLGVITTDAQDGALREVDGVRWVDPSVPDGAAVLAGLLAVGTEVNVVTAGRDSVFLAMEVQANTANAGFVRPTADLHVIVVSDDDDHSSLTNINEFISWCLTFKRAPSRVTFSSIVGYPDPEPSCPGVSAPGAAYLAATRAVGGVEWNLCNVDWVSALWQLDLSVNPGDRFPLSRIPVPGTIEVEVTADGIQWAPQEGVDWIWEPTANSIWFDEDPPPFGAEVTLTYEVAW